LVLALLAGWLALGQATVTQPFVRFFYPHGRANRVAKLFVRSWSWIVATGLTPSRWPGEPPWGSSTIVVKGRHSGEDRTSVATWIEHEGERYFVSMNGQGADWVKNLRAAGGWAQLRRGKRQAVTLEELPVSKRASVIRAWYRRTWRSTQSRLGLDPHAGIEEFELLAHTHPVFKVVTHRQG